MSASICTVQLDPSNLSDTPVDATARAVAGLSWIDNRVERYWDQIDQGERDYWLRFAKAGLLGLSAQARRESVAESASVNTKGD